MGEQRHPGSVRDGAHYRRFFESALRALLRIGLSVGLRRTTYSRQVVRLPPSSFMWDVSAGTFARAPSITYRCRIRWIWKPGISSRVTLFLFAGSMTGVVNETTQPRGALQQRPRDK